MSIWSDTALKELLEREYAREERLVKLEAEVQELKGAILGPDVSRGTSKSTRGSRVS